MNGAVAARQSDHEAKQPERLISNGQVFAVLGAAGCGVALAGAGQSAVATALPLITSDIGALIHLAWPVTGYLVGLAVTLPLHGKLSDVFGRRPAYLLAMMIFMAGAAFAGQSNSMGQLVASTALQGVGAGGLLALAFVILGDLTSPSQRAAGRGYLIATWAFATLAGPALGGLVVSQLGWRWLFYANLPVGAIILMVVAIALTVHIRPQERDLDLVGALLLSLGLGLVLLYIAWHGPVRGWLTTSSLVLLAEGIAAIVLFMAWENRVAEPLLPLRLLRDRTVVKASLCGAILGSAVFGVILLLPLYIQVSSGTTPAWSGLLVLPIAGGAAMGAVFASKLTQDRILAQAGAATVLAALVVLAWQTPSDLTWEPVLALLLAGAGLGVSCPALTRLARDAAPSGQAGAAVAGGLFLQAISSAVGASLLGAGLATVLARYEPIDLLTSTNLRPDVLRALPDAERDAVLGAFTQALQVALGIAALAVAFGLLLSFLIKPLPRRTPADLAAWETVTELVKREPVPRPAPPQRRTETQPVQPAPAEPPLVSRIPQPAAPGPAVAVADNRPPQRPPKPPREYPWSQWSRRRQLATAGSAIMLTFATLYGGGLAYAGPGVLRGTSVHGVPIGGLQPAEAEQKIVATLGPAAAAPFPVKAGTQTLMINPRLAGLDINPAATVAGSAQGSYNPIRLFTVIFTAQRQIPLRTSSDPARLNAALAQLDLQVRRNPTDGTILFNTGQPRIVESTNGQAVDIPRSATAVSAGYLQRPIGIPLIVLPPRVSNAEINRAMNEFARPAVSRPITVNAEGKTAVLPPSVFAPHLGVAPDALGRLHPTVDGDGVLRDGGGLLGPLQSSPKAEVSKIVKKKKVVVEPGYDGHVIGKDDLTNAMVNALQDGSRVANVPLTTVHP